MTKRHPDSVLAALLSEEGLADTIQEKLRAIHALCRTRFDDDERDFSISTIGKLVTAAGLMNGRGLANKTANRYRDLIGAWQLHADHQWLGDTANLPQEHPDSVLMRLLADDRFKANRKMTLRAFHDVCRRHHATGSLDWSPKAVGQLCAAHGVMHEHNLTSNEFADFRTLLNAWSNFARPWLAAEPKGEPARRVQKSHDTTLEWVRRDYPEFEAWRLLAAEWLQGAGAGLNQRIAALTAFFKNYLTRPDVPDTPAALLARGRTLPDYQAVACPGSTAGANYNNHIHAFFQWVLLRDFSDISDDGERVVSPAFRNPLKAKTKAGAYVPDESVRSPLPYGYVHELRHILAEGLNFRDWLFAQAALGVAPGEVGARGRDWFEVPQALIDPADPDCVWRVRKNKDGVDVHQMWSPVRWVAVLTKLLVPARTLQVRLLDSGESDTWAYRAGAWELNSHPLAAGKKGNVWQQGVFRRSPSPRRRQPGYNAALLQHE